MFTGLVQDIGTVTQVQREDRASRVTVSTGLDLSDLASGESVAINGTCFTVVAHTTDSFTIDISPESLDRTNLSHLNRGDQVHLERAMRLSDRLGGHLVLGHVDGVGRLAKRRAEGNAWHLTFEVPAEVRPYLIPKGCIAVDGVSLTINRCDPLSFDVTIVPHTHEKTLLTRLSVGAEVNLEADVIGKYVVASLHSSGHCIPGLDSDVNGTPTTSPEPGEESPQS